MNDAVRVAARALMKRLDEIKEHPAYKSVWSLNYAHGGRYDGPTWEGPYNDLKEALSAAPAPEPVKPAHEREPPHCSTCICGSNTTFGEMATTIDELMRERDQLRKDLAVLQSKYNDLRNLISRDGP